MKSRILQALALIVLFVLGVVLFGGGSSSEGSSTSTEGYVPPSP
jgi:hypothetical protein